MRRLFVLAALLFAVPAHAVTIEWVSIPKTPCCELRASRRGRTREHERARGLAPSLSTASSR